MGTHNCCCVFVLSHRLALFDHTACRTQRRQAPPTGRTRTSGSQSTLRIVCRPSIDWSIFELHSKSIAHTDRLQWTDWRTWLINHVVLFCSLLAWTAVSPVRWTSKSNALDWRAWLAMVSSVLLTLFSCGFSSVCWKAVRKQCDPLELRRIRKLSELLRTCINSGKKFSERRRG